MSFKEKINCIAFALKLSKDFNKSIYVFAAFYCLFGAIVPLIPTYFSAKIVDELAGSRDVKTLIILAVLMVVLTAVFEFGRHIFEKGYADRRNLLHDFESKVFEEHIVNADYELLEDADFQNAIKSYKIIYENNYGIYGNLWYNIVSFIQGILSLVFSIIIVFPSLRKCFEIDNSTFINSYKPILILLVSVIIVGVSLSLVGNKWASINLKVNKKWNSIFSIFKYWFSFPNKYQNGKEIRIYNANKLIFEKQADYENSWHEINSYSYVLWAKFNTVMVILQMLLMGCFYLFVALKAYAGVFSIGSFVLFLGASLHIADGIGMVSAISYLLGMSAEHVTYLKQIVETPPRKHVGTLPVEKRSDNRFEIEFKNVSFKYPGTENYVLKNFNVKLEIGHHMAVVGQNGSGKTTFIKLLCRLYDVTDGEITLNGINIKKYDLKEYMSLFSVVFQDFQLFSVPLSQNITTSLEYDKAKLCSCLDKAGIKERVEQMPDRENSVIYKDFDENGIEISGGEAQKIALARALYKDAPFVILDEPTSALDPISEFEIYQRFNSFVGEKTAIYISHRLSSCRFCDEILVFDEGRIIQQGSHESLLRNTDGKYYRLWTAQSQYYI